MRFNVYVPNQEADERTGICMRSIDPKSAIVSLESDSERVHIYYEGNRYGASNIKTFADRCMIAAYRCRDQYPTVAQAAVVPKALTLVGTYDLDSRRVDVLDGKALAGWLGGGVDAAELVAS